MRRRSASNGACSGQYGCKTAETSVSGSARKSQTRLRDTPRFKFQAVLPRTQPFLSRSVEKRGDQSRFKSLGLYINVILVAGVGTFRHTSAVLMASRHALSPRCETKTMFSAPFNTEMLIEYLPRQARDKHRKRWGKEDRLWCRGAPRLAPRLVHPALSTSSTGAETHFLHRLFRLKHDLGAKTGSGQTEQSKKTPTEKRRLFCREVRKRSF
jgi:hypothetical protein